MIFHSTSTQALIVSGGKLFTYYGKVKCGEILLNTITWKGLESSVLRLVNRFVLKSTLSYVSTRGQIFLRPFTNGSHNLKILNIHSKATGPFL